MYITNDPVADFGRYDSEQEKWLKKLPVCRECGEHIQDEQCYMIDGEVICESCMDSYKVYVENLI